MLSLCRKASGCPPQLRAAAWGTGAVEGPQGGAGGLATGCRAGSGAPWGVRVSVSGVGRTVPAEPALSAVLRPAAPSPRRAPAGEV